MSKMQIFEPALCCETGVCGVSVDPELLRISTVLNTLKKNNVLVDRFNLNSSPMEFVTNETINKFVNEKGVDELPATIMDGKIIITGRYPSNQEFIDLLDLKDGIIAAQSKEDSEQMERSCCCGEGGCC